MVSNPTRDGQGGDVGGTKAVDITQGEPLRVSAASFDPGYSLATTLSDAGTRIRKDDLTTGYCTYGQAIGE